MVPVKCPLIKTEAPSGSEVIRTSSALRKFVIEKIKIILRIAIFLQEFPALLPMFRLLSYKV